MAYCSRCDRYFPHNPALAQHKRDSHHHHICTDCNLDFTTFTGLKEHRVQSPRHHYCQICDLEFEEREDLIGHFHSQHGFCDSCQNLYRTRQGLHEHRRQVHTDRYCTECRRMFISVSNFKAHMQSSVHQDKTVRCKFCDRVFISGPDLASHLESGTCASGITRHRVNDIVRSYDTRNVITNPGRMIGGSSITTYHATSSSWNTDVQAYECYLCHRYFTILSSLNQHLESPAHEEKIYVCPLSSCKSEFVTLSGLWRHIESERCGVKKFAVVRDALDGIMGKMRRIGL